MKVRLDLVALEAFGVPAGTEKHQRCWRLMIHGPHARLPLPHVSIFSVETQ